MLLLELDKAVVEDLPNRHDLFARVVELRQVVVLLDHAFEVVAILEIGLDVAAGDLRLAFVDDAGALAELVDDKVVAQLDVEELRLAVVAEVTGLFAVHFPDVELGKVV